MGMNAHFREIWFSCVMEMSVGHLQTAKDGLHLFAAESRRAKLRTIPTTNLCRQCARPIARHMGSVIDSSVGQAWCCNGLQ